jgi:hypothetical protein
MDNHVVSQATPQPPLVLVTQSVAWLQHNVWLSVRKSFALTWVSVWLGDGIASMLLAMLSGLTGGAMNPTDAALPFAEVLARGAGVLALSSCVMVRMATSSWMSTLLGIAASLAAVAITMTAGLLPVVAAGVGAAMIAGGAGLALGVCGVLLALVLVLTLFVRLSVVGMLAAREQKDPWAALRKTWRLTRTQTHSWWDGAPARIAVVLLCSTLLSSGAQILSATPRALVGRMVGQTLGFRLADSWWGVPVSVFEAVVSGIVLAWFARLLMLLHNDLRLRAGEAPLP